MTKRAKRLPEDKALIAKKLDAARQQSIVQEKLFPAFVNATTSIDEAKMLSQAITSVIMEESMKVLSQKKISEIRSEIVKKLTSEGREAEVDALLAVLDDETLFTARVLIEGFKSAIDRMLLDESQSRTLASLDMDWKRIFAPINLS